jgi:hypothetical protein
MQEPQADGLLRLIRLDGVEFSTPWHRPLTKTSHGRPRQTGPSFNGSIQIAPFWIKVPSAIFISRRVSEVSIALYPRINSPCTIFHPRSSAARCAEPSRDGAMTRSRADGDACQRLDGAYRAQRASAGLIIWRVPSVGKGCAHTRSRPRPRSAWKVTQAVHAQRAHLHATDAVVRVRIRPLAGNASGPSAIKPEVRRGPCQPGRLRHAREHSTTGVPASSTNMARRPAVPSTRADGVELRASGTCRSSSSRRAATSGKTDTAARSKAVPASCWKCWPRWWLRRVPTGSASRFRRR